ncbi:MAG: hypothetical protein AAF430_24805 [Myxococcota bacterium]
MTRWIWTFAILVIAALTIIAPNTEFGRRGSDAAVRSDAPSAWKAVGQSLPELSLQHLDGTPFDLSSLAGHRVLLTFERSVDW